MKNVLFLTSAMALTACIVVPSEQSIPYNGNDVSYNTSSNDSGFDNARPDADVKVVHGTLTHDPSIHLADYQWKLRHAQKNTRRNRHKLRDTDIKVSFSQKRIQLSGACNRFSSNVSNLGRNSFRVGALASTRMACDSRLMRQDRLISDFFDQKTIQYAAQHVNGKTVLTLRNNQNDTLTLEGILSNEEVLYGNRSETVFIEISAKKNSQCQTDSDCYRYRFVTYTPNYTKQYGPWQQGIPAIKNYTKDPNIREIVRVKKFPTQGTESLYVFDMRVEQEYVR